MYPRPPTEDRRDPARSSMKGTRMRRLASTALAALSFAGCTFPLGGVHLVMGGDFAALPPLALLKRVTGRTCHVDSGQDIGNLGLAVDDALRSVPGANAIVGATFTVTQTSYVYVVKTCIVVEGQAARVRIEDAAQPAEER